MQFETEETMTPHIEHCNVVYTHREKHSVDDSDSNIMSISSENKEEAKLSEMEENCMAIFSYMSTFKLTGIASEHEYDCSTRLHLTVIRYKLFQLQI